MENLSVGWKGGAMQNAALSDTCHVQNLPVLNMTIQVGEAWNEYEKLSEQHPLEYVYGSPKLGRQSFNRMYDGMTRLIKEKHALSYYYTDALSSLEGLRRLVDRLKTLWDENHLPNAPAATFAEVTDLAFGFDDLLQALKQAETHVKYGLRKHVNLADCDGSVLHCAHFAVGEPCSISKSAHTFGSCVECLNFVQVGDAVRLMMNAVANSLGRERNDADEFARAHDGGPVNECLSMGEPITALSRTLNLYQRHVFRGVFQNNAVLLAGNMKVGQVVIIMDHKQKINGVNFTESSEEYYGKKGISVLGFLLRWRTEDGGPVHTHYLDVVSSNSKQDASQVRTLMSKVLPVVKELIPSAKSVVIISDNGPSFASADHIKFVFDQNRIKWDWGLVLDRWVFFEAQCGKTALDTHFAFIGILIRRFARKARAVKNHQDVFDALGDGGGIANTTTLHVEFMTDEDDKDDDAGDKSDVKVSNIRKVHDIVFTEEGATTFFFSGVVRNSGVLNGLAGNKPIITSPAEVCAKFHSEKASQSRPSAANRTSASASGPLLRFTALTRPHDILISEAMMKFATEMTEVQPLLLVETTVAACAKTTADTTASGKTKKQRLLEEFRTTFEYGWAESDQRLALEMPLKLQDDAKKMVSIGRIVMIWQMKTDVECPYVPVLGGREEECQAHTSERGGYPFASP
jgi:hypothetical protein